MNEIEIFKNSEFGEIRTTVIDGEPWFVGKDVAKALGYGEGKSLPNAVANHVDDEDKGAIKMMTPGGEQNVIIINESGLYSLVLSSKLPSAKKFKHWVTHDVIPSIRKTGCYTISNNRTPYNVQDGLLWIEGISKGLRLSDSSKLKLYKEFCEPLGLPIPDYVNSKGVLHSATELLRENNISLSARSFNKLAVSYGILCDMERPSTHGIKRFKNLTERGLQYGENLVNPQNPKETQPMYYDDKFCDLCSYLGIDV